MRLHPACGSGRLASSKSQFGYSADARDFPAYKVPVEIAKVLFQLPEGFTLRKVVGEFFEVGEPHLTVLPVDVTSGAHGFSVLPGGDFPLRQRGRFQGMAILTRVALPIRQERRGTLVLSSFQEFRRP